MTRSGQLCTFVLGEYLFGVDVTSVQEVIRAQPMTRVPLAPATVRGLINLRGQIVTAIEMRSRLGLEERQGPEPMNVVARTSDGVISLLVDEIGDVVEADERLFERAPETMSGPFRDLVVGVYKLDHRLLLVLDVERVASDLGQQGRPKGETS